MFIKEVDIKNFRIFPSDRISEIGNINIPNGQPGSGLTVFVGENGCGKTNFLDAISFALLEYKSDSFDIDDLNDLEKDCEISVFANNSFEVNGLMKGGAFTSVGFYFKGKIKEKSTKQYLSKITTNTREYIPEKKEDKDYNPKLSVNVNNPFSPKPRYDKLDVLYLERNRNYQIKSGAFNKTRFDRLMADFNFQLINSGTKEGDASDVMMEAIKKIEGSRKNKKKIENNFLATAVEKFKEISDHEIKLNFLNNLKPFSSAFFASRTENNIQITLDKLGSGYEGIFSILYSFYLARQTGKNLIILIDEPEMHLHPKLQEDFIKILLEFSIDCQVIITTHSPLFVKQALCNENVKINIVNKEIQGINRKNFLLDRVSSNEINHVAFGLATEEYHNELYNEIEANFWNDPNNDFTVLKQNGSYDKKDCRQIIFDNEFFSKQKEEPVASNFRDIKNKVTIHTFIRNQIHHQKDNGKPDPQILKSSIERMREFFIITK
jgi:predicted ATP-dependent endonuclease of OLD family